MVKKELTNRSHKISGFFYIFIRIPVLIQNSLEDFLCSSRHNIYIINEGKSVKLLLSGEYGYTHTYDHDCLLALLRAHKLSHGHGQARYVISYFSASLLTTVYPISIKSICINCCYSYILNLIRVGNLSPAMGLGTK